MTPPRKFSQTTSAFPTSRLTISIASGRRRSSVMDRLLPFIERNEGAILRSAHVRSAGEMRVSSPSWDSILMTSAPSRASW
jgi:hypothetical protein